MEQNNSIQTKFGNRVRELRQSKGLSQESFAHLCNLDRTYISGIERGIRNVSLRNIEVISKALGLSIAELFKDLRGGCMPEKKPNEAKQKILEMLWSMEWVDGKDIFKAIEQTYYDRRVRELRESGWQIQTVGQKYRLVSHEKLAGNERKYPSAKQKRQVLERDKGICQICGANDAHTQFDHKVPQERLGKTEVDNLQLLCRACNVEKRGVCKRCPLTTCDGCPYAYPELFGGRFMVMLDKPLTEKIRADARQKGLSESALIAEFLKNRYGL